MEHTEQDVFRNLLRKHHELDFAFRDRDGKLFFSDWNCEHPFVEEYLSDVSPEMSRASGVHHYKFFEDEDCVVNAIDQFHTSLENISVSNANLLGGDGSTPLIYTFCAWLFEKQINEIYYIPPLYYNFYYFGGLFSQRLRPVAPVHPFESGFELNLPNKRTVLIVCDPIWYAGFKMPRWVYDELERWQERTGSTIFVDGSFQYMNWEGLVAEPSARLVPDKTFRIICPTKALAVHGFRFSYMLLPRKHRNALRYIYANSHGPGNVHSLRFAKSAMNRLSTPQSNHKLIAFIKERYETLAKHDAFTECVEPDCGYFMFGKMNWKEFAWDTIDMDGEFFEQSRYPGYSRINLLGPDTGLFIHNMNRENSL